MCKRSNYIKGEKKGMTYVKKKWRADREKIILESDGKCAWCRNESPLIVHHTNPPEIGLRKYDEIAITFMEEYFYNGVHEDEFNKLLVKSVNWVLEKTKRTIIKRCPICYKATIYERTTMSPKYRCTNCGYIGDEIFDQKNVWYPNLERSVLFYFKQDYKEQIKIKYDEYKLKAKKDYVDLENSDIVLICKRCHFAYHNGMVLCKICKKTYHKRQYPSCYTCKTETAHNGGFVQAIV